MYGSQCWLVTIYNKYMSGVDKSDQLIGKYNSLRTNRYWKTLFYHFLDIARVNSYIMFQEWRKCNNNNELERPAHYGQLEFLIESMKQLACIANDSRIPIYESTEPKSTDHPVNPKWSDKSNNCKRCYRLHKKERRTMVICATCGHHLCFSNKRDCLNEEHN